MAKHPGRPSGETPKTVLSHATKTAPTALVPLDDPDPRLHQHTTIPRCPICTQLLERPIELGCGTIICLGCCTNWIQFHHPPLSCPCCYLQLDSEHIRPPPPLIVTLLQGLLVHCMRGCGKIVQLGQYEEHLKGGCRSHYHQLADSPSKLTISEVLSRPSSSPATPAEVQVAGHLVRKIMNHSDGTSQGVIKIPQRGQVSKLN